MKMAISRKSFFTLNQNFLSIIGLLVATSVFWGRYLFERGIHAETYFTILSQNREFFEGFLYPEKNRPFMSLLFHLAYIFSDGSYLSLHLFYGLTIFLTGLLTYFLLLELFGEKCIGFCFIAGVLTIINGAEESANLFSMIIVRQALILILVAALIACKYYKNKNFKYFCILIPLCHYLSLWTYEAGFPLIVAMGIALFFYKRGRMYIFFLWYLIPLYFIINKINYYLVEGQTSYQSQKIVFHSAQVILEKFYLYIKYGADFLIWPQIWLPRFLGCESEAIRLMLLPIIFGVISILLIFILIVRRSNYDFSTPSYSYILAFFILLISSYAPFIFVSDGSPTWRTQFYAAPFLAFFLSLFCFVIYQIRLLKFISPIVLITILSCGFFSGLSGQLEASKRWLVYRNAVEGIATFAPVIKNGSTIILLGVPTGDPMQICKDSDPPDPFSDQLWFNFGINVLYPKTNLRGFYARNDDSYPPSSGERVVLEENAVSLISKNKGEVLSIPYEEVLIFQYDANIKKTVLLSKENLKKRDYDPAALILGDSTPPITKNKFKAHVTNLP
jgi:hypothetical protein